MVEDEDCEHLLGFSSKRLLGVLGKDKSECWGRDWLTAGGSEWEVRTSSQYMKTKTSDSGGTVVRARREMRR